MAVQWIGGVQPGGRWIGAVPGTAAPAASFTITPATLPANHLGNLTVALVGTGTSWTSSTTFAASGVAGWLVASKAWTDATHYSVVLTPPTSATPPAGATGTLTLTEGVTGTAVGTATVGTPTLAISPTSGTTGTTPTLTLTGANTLWTTETAAGLFTESGGTGASIGTPTVTTNTAATDALTVGSAAGTLTITDHSTGATATYTASAPAVATSYTLAGPSSGTVNVASTNFTVTPNGTTSGTVTPASTGAGTFSPTSLTWTGDSAVKTFTYTPTSTSGSPHSVSITSSPVLTYSGSPVAYTVNAASTAKRSDNFNRANSTLTANPPSDGLSNPVVFRGSTGLPVYGINTNRLYCPTAGGAGGGLVWEASASDVDVSVKAASVTNSFAGLVFRWSSPIDFLYLYFFPGSPGTLYVYQYAAGASTQLATTTTTLAQGDVLKVHAAGSAITVFINGSHVAALDCTSTFNQAATAHGLMLQNPGDFLDDFSVADNNSGAMTGYFVSADPTTVNLNALSGTGPFQWYRSTTFGFTPGAGNILAGKTTQVLADSSGLTAGVAYEYALVASGSSETVRVYGSLGLAAVSFGAVGDSITAGLGPTGVGVTGLAPPERAALMLSKSMGTFRKVTAVNQGHVGATTTNWVSGSSYLIQAKSLFAAMGCTHVFITLGVNDAAGVSAATYGTQLASCANDLVSAGYVVLLNYPTFVTSSSTSQNNMAAYLAQIDALVNGSTIRAGDKEAWRYFGEHPSELRSEDGIHQTEAGAESWAGMLAAAVSRAVDGVPGTGAGGSGLALSRLVGGL